VKPRDPTAADANAADYASEAALIARWHQPLLGREVSLKRA
jgi:hypothetical protein